MEGDKILVVESQSSLDISIQKKYYREAFRLIDEAMKFEDINKEQEAIESYKKGLQSISSGMSIVIPYKNLNTNETKEYDKRRDNLSRARQQVLQRLSVLNIDMEQHNSSNRFTDNDAGPSGKSEKCEMSGAYKRTLPSAPPPPPDIGESYSHLQHKKNDGSNSWHDSKELVCIEEGVRLFQVHGTHVTKLMSSCILQVFQILDGKLDQNSPPAFLKCGEWIFPLQPARSPVLKVAERTYIFPDVSNTDDEVENSSDVPCVGIVLSEFVPENIVLRFERVLSLYSNYRTVNIDTISDSQVDPPLPLILDKDKENELSPYEMETIIAEPGVQESSTEEKTDWSRKVSKGIHIGSEWISWGLLKGTEIASVLVEKGASSLKKRISPNLEASSISTDTSQNIRQLHQTTGSVVQISAFLVSSLGTLTANLGKKLGPLVLHHGQKLLPDKYKTDNNPKTSEVLEDARKVAVAGLQGFSLIFLALEQSGKNLYRTVSNATIETVEHKYGKEAGFVTKDAMGAAGNTAQVFWNVRKLGIKSVAKQTAKATGKVIINYDEDENLSAHNQNRND